MNSDLVALSLLSGAETAHAFSSFLPSTFTVKSFALDSSTGNVGQKVADLRAGYRPATAFGILLGAVVSVVAKSPLPLAASAGAAGVMLVLYERNLPPEMRVGPIAALFPELAASGPAATALPAPSPTGPRTVGI